MGSTIAALFVVGPLPKIPGSGSPNVSAGLGAESRNRGSCFMRLVGADTGGVGVGEIVSRSLCNVGVEASPTEFGAGVAFRVAVAGVGGMTLVVGGMKGFETFVGEADFFFFSGPETPSCPSLGSGSCFRFLSLSLSLSFSSPLALSLFTGDLSSSPGTWSPFVSLFFFFFFLFSLGGATTISSSKRLARAGSVSFALSLPFAETFVAVPLPPATALTLPALL